MFHVCAHTNSNGEGDDMTPTAQLCHDQSRATPEVNPLVMRWVLPNRLLNTVLPAEVLYVYPLIVENLGIGGDWRTEQHHFGMVSDCALEQW